MKKFLAVLLLSALVACNTSEGLDHTDTNEYLEDSEILSQESLPTIPLKEIEKDIDLEIELQTNKGHQKVFIEKVAESKQIEQYTFDQYILYVEGPKSSEVTVQIDLHLYDTLLPEELDFEKIQFRGQELLLASYEKENQTREYFLWVLDDYQLIDITFDGEPTVTSIPVEDVPIKVLKTNYLQTFTYKNPKDEAGFIFSTWSYHKDQYSFVLHSEERYGNKEEERETGKYLAEKWLTYKDYFIDFPYYTFTEDDYENLLKGYLPDIPFALGTPIEDIIESYTIFEEDYYDGGPYYETKDGLYFYHEGTEKVSVITISGNRFKNAEDIEDILGKPKSSGRSDMYPDETFSIYEWDDYVLWLIYNEEHELLLMELHSKVHK